MLYFLCFLLTFTLRQISQNIDCTIGFNLSLSLYQGLVGIATATASTYVVALTDSTAQHGYLKMKITLLANHVRDAFSPLEDNPLP
jgi:hypothetical protein